MSTKSASKVSRAPSRTWRGGFAITSMAMWDADAPRGASTFWSSSDFVSSSGAEQVATLPASVLRCRAVTRRMAFSTVAAIAALRVVQTVFLHGARLEQWTFDCGFVIPGCVRSAILAGG
jgi:retinal rod rhodopsin-sensitive cGMP 3',5'-cyclic phosphodiesterase subunit delta